MIIVDLLNWVIYENFCNYIISLLLNYLGVEKKKKIILQQPRIKIQTGFCTKDGTW